METLNLISEWLAHTLDHVLGWLLLIPRDGAILIIALGTSLVLTYARKWTTNQERLGRCKRDVKRLKQLRREAKRAKDKETVKQIKKSLGMIAMMKAKSEGLPTLVSLLPIILLASWAWMRLDYFPPKADDVLTVRAYYPLASEKKLTRIEVPKGVKMESSAVQFVKLDPNGEVNGLAEWKLRPAAADAITVIIRHQGQSAEHTFSVGGKTYIAPLLPHTSGKIVMTEVVLKQAKFLGIVPGIPQVFCPPWLLAYFLITIPFVPIFRKVLRVH